MVPETDIDLPNGVERSLNLLESLLHRATQLLDEFKTYQAYLQSNNRSKDVEARIFRRGVESEVKRLRAARQKEHESSRTAPEVSRDEEAHASDGMRNPGTQDKQTVPDTGSTSSEWREEAEVDVATKSLGTTNTHDVGDFADVTNVETIAKKLHILRSSNLPYYEAIWQTAKCSLGIRALGKRVYWDAYGSKGPRLPRGRASSKNALVDLVSDDGLMWTKVSILNQKRLLFEIAKEGWENYADVSEESYAEPVPEAIASNGDKLYTLETSTSKLELVRLAEDLRHASRSIRLRYRHPQVRFVLPRLVEGEQSDVDAMLADIRATGAVVQCGLQPPPSFPLLQLLPSLLPSSYSPTLSSTLNIDCTILLALISDISHLPHTQLPPSPTRSGHYHKAILKQIESEEQAPLLPTEIYPALAGRDLVCTDLAAQRMLEIVNTMGTQSERIRADIILGEGDATNTSSTELTSRWRKNSAHETPDDIRLPIKVETTCSTALHLSSIAKSLTSHIKLSPINASVFLYGWHNDVVTITSNRVVANQIEKGLNEILNQEEAAGREVKDFEGPKMWVCESARSLVGKERQDGLRP